MPSVTYDGNGSDGGSPPIDPNSPYAVGAKVTVLPVGSLTKTGAIFAYWNTQADGSGTFYGWPVAGTFTMPATDVVLYAQWLVTTGLTNGGVTAHYAFAYDSSLAGSVEPTRTEALLQLVGGVPVVEGDYNLMANTWFPGVGPGRPLPIHVYVTRLTGGAHNATNVTLMPNGTDPNELRSLLVAELTESFMFSQHKGWGYAGGSTSEQSCGEALSLFLTEQFQLQSGIAFTSNNTSNTWLNSSLPASNPSSTRYYDKTSSSQGYDYGSRFDYVNKTLDWAGNGPGTGCGMLFLYYLFHQLGFQIPAIIAAAPGFDSNGQPVTGSCLRGVYQNLTGDTSDPFPFFAQLLANAYPPDLVTSIPGSNPDDPWPLARFGFWGVKDTFGPDEVRDLLKPPSSGVYPNGFSLSLEGFNTQVLGTTVPSPPPTIAFGGVTAVPAASGALTIQFSNPNIPQRMLFNYDIQFTPPLGTFPATGQLPTPAQGSASIKVLGTTFDATTEFFFLAGADPYFTNVQRTTSSGLVGNQSAPWLSQDLRVFTATPGQPGKQIPVPSPEYVAPPQSPVPPGAPSFVENNAYGNYDIQGAYTYITNLIAYLNKYYGDPSKVDPFDISNSILPGQLTAYTGDLSVTPGTLENFAIYNNYNFAIARVRLQGVAGPNGATPGVKVFFRLWQTQTADTDWNPGYTYLSDDPTGLNPQYPKAPSDNHTIPFFATANYPVLDDMPNNQTITIEQGDTQWAYFGCFLNLYDGNFEVNNQSVQQQFAKGTHHCLVAEIAYAGAPIENVNNTTETTENSAQLAQRNVQVTTSANPGNLATHRIPQTFDIRRSDPTATGQGSSTQPDELMIDWGNTPEGCLASIYWPGAVAADILSIASRLYGSQVLSAADSHTIQCTTTRNVTYVPIPPGTGESLAGLLTIDLPSTVVKGQEFNVLIRRIGTRQVAIAPPPPQTQARTRARSGRARARHAAASAASLLNLTTERYVVGSFQVKIPVTTKEAMLPAEETTLAIFKARLGVMSPTDRWYPVLRRYIGLLSARVNGLGGNANAIPPSFGGYTTGAPICDERKLEFTGKICEVIFDCFGDFVGFVLCTCSEDHRFHTRERAICDIVLRACKERLQVSVFVERGRDHKIKELVIRC